MSVLDAMNRVQSLLNAGELEDAQLAVYEIESRESVLPSSMFESVLRAAVKADRLLPRYEQFCNGAYGRRQYASMVEHIKGTLALESMKIDHGIV